MLNNDDANPLTFGSIPVKDTLLTLNANRVTNIG